MRVRRTGRAAGRLVKNDTCRKCPSPEARPDELTALHPLRLRCHPSTVPCRDHRSRGHGRYARPILGSCTLQKSVRICCARELQRLNPGERFIPPAPRKKAKRVPSQIKKKGADAPLCLAFASTVVHAFESNPSSSEREGRRAPRLHRSPARPTRSFHLHAEQDGDPGLLVGVARLKSL